MSYGMRIKDFHKERICREVWAYCIKNDIPIIQRMVYFPHILKKLFPGEINNTDKIEDLFLMFYSGK